METWRAFHSRDGPKGSRNALGNLLFPPVIPARLMRSEVAGLVPHCLPLAANTMVCHGTQIAAMYNTEDGDCRLLDQDRHTLAGQPSFAPLENSDYLEINCAISDPKKLCIYDEVKGKILKTVDSVYQGMASKEDCEDLCNNAPFRCHSYDFNDTGDNVCRLSHHSAHTLTQIEEPYLAIEEATTYELSSCYNVTITCHSGDMTATIQTSALFNGKIYAKSSPVNCVVDVSKALNFSITMAYNDLECGVEREAPGVYTNEIIVQHHDRIVTSDDLGLDLTCQYDLTNKSVSNTVDLTITGEISPALYEEAVVESPNVIMRVENLSGEDTKTAVVGDPLNLVFEILDEDSPYEIFVRDLVAMDGATDTELLLIDGRGCPADATIMSELRKSAITPKMLLSSFDAFRFPTSQVVQFRALVTPCMPTCEPVQCEILDYTGQNRGVESYGRKKRWLSTLEDTFQSRRRRNTPEAEEVLVVQTIQILDKMGKRKQARTSPPKGFFPNQFNVTEHEEIFDHVGISNSRCLLDSTLMVSGIAFVVVQLFLLFLWTLLLRKKRNLQAKEIIMPSESSIADSMSYMYESGVSRRFH
eukprot:maker-scaffold30_size591359-snap-gene-1.15 protein:Tk12749 transcript:maker-scaffold30_size591359-snap-gene-1.15-mRNA-1 annotation:"hypothetical protein DAPPUDRAFT_214208"